MNMSIQLSYDTVCSHPNIMDGFFVTLQNNYLNLFPCHASTVSQTSRCLVLADDMRSNCFIAFALILEWNDMMVCGVRLHPHKVIPKAS